MDFLPMTFTTVIDQVGNTYIVILQRDGVEVVRIFARRLGGARRRPLSSSTML
jgi:hypothetical protein